MFPHTDPKEKLRQFVEDAREQTGDAIYDIMAKLTSDCILWGKADVTMLQNVVTAIWDVVDEDTRQRMYDTMIDEHDAFCACCRAKSKTRTHGDEEMFDAEWMRLGKQLRERDPEAFADVEKLFKRMAGVQS